ncbi:RidA family protein [Edaphovirga cremea]|uniref:RidA family protein n=1 Tax=Edaphovirga cremea TaxID=2267246 RepID=UPI000DEFED8A|nr:RidA family protein [Edaphovirga cremea]
MKKQINTNNAPVAIGPYSQAISLDKLVFTSGQLPLDPHSMTIVEGKITEQARASLANLKAILEECGASIDSVVKTTCFLADINDFAAFNAVYTDVFGSELAPARSCVEVARLPKDALVEVEAIAYIKN